MNVAFAGKRLDGVGDDRGPTFRTGWKIALNCPTLLLLGHIADKWATLMLSRISSADPLQPVAARGTRHLDEGFSQALKRLGHDGLVAREVFPTVPATVEHSITPLGQTLTDRITAMTAWAQENIRAVLAAQDRYDRECASGPRLRPSSRMTVGFAVS